MRTVTDRLLRPLNGLFVILFCLTPLCAEDKVPAEQVLPKDTMLMVSVPDVSELKARFADTIWSDMFTNPEMVKFWDALTESLKEPLDELKQETGLDWKQLLEIPSGEVTVAVTRISRGKIGATLSIQYGDNDETVNKLLTTAEQKLENLGPGREVEEIEGTEVSKFALTRQEGSPDPTLQLCWYQKDGFLVVSNEVRALEAVLLRWDGKNSEVLAEQEEFKYIRERCSPAGSQPVMYWYVNPLLALRSALETGQSTTQQAMVQAFLPQLGLDKLRAIGGSVDLATERYEEITQTVIYADSPQTGLLKMFQASEVTISPPDWVSADSESFLIYHWGLESAVSEVRRLVDSFQGPGAFDVLLDQLADHPSSQGLHPKKDFIDVLTGTMVAEITPPPGGEGSFPVNLFAVEVKDAEKMRSVLATIQKADSGAVTTRSFQGNTIYELPMPGGAKLNLVVSQSYLFLTPSAERIEQVIRGGDSYPRLKDSKAFEQLVAEAPESAGLWGMEQTGSQLERASKQISELLKTLPVPAGEDESALALLEHLPSTEVLKKYAMDTFFYATTDERGVYWKSYSLRAKK